jgi:hypothetical protein
MSTKIEHDTDRERERGRLLNDRADLRHIIDQRLN